MDGGIGHNSDIRSTLLETHAAKFSRKKDLIEAAARVPEIKDDEGAGKVGDFIKQLAHCRKSLEDTRKVEKQPYDEMADQVHSLFKPAVDDLEAAEDALKGRLTKWMDETGGTQTRGEYGSVTSSSRRWTFRDLDPAAIDLEVLRPFLSVEALEKALRAFIRGGGRTIKGAVIFESKAAVVR